MYKRADTGVDVGNTIVVAHQSRDWVSRRPDSSAEINCISTCSIGRIDITIGGTGITIGLIGSTTGRTGSTILIKRCEFLDCRC